MAATAQLNARMSKELKSSGDKILAEAGISPTKLVRLVWGKVASGREGLNQLLEVLQAGGAHPQERTQTSEHASARAQAIRGEQLFAEGVARLGLSQRSASGAFAPTDWKDQREEAIANRLEERGIL